MSASSTTLPPDTAAVAPDTVRRLEELGQIIAAYNDVTEKLQSSHDQLTRTVQSLRQELGEKNRLLERKNRLAALGEMAAGMAHEIRNPLGGIQLYASLLAQDMEDRPEALQRVKKISGGVKRLEALVGQVLQFTREMTAHPQQIDLAETIDQAIEYATPTLESHHVTCRVDGPRPMPVTADPTLLVQAILNLLLNAAEAIEDQGSIEIAYGQPENDAERQFQIIITDTGPGIASKLLDKVFNPFFTTKDSGTGLGLAIVHRVVEAHDGAVTASNAIGGGARFEVRI